VVISRVLHRGNLLSATSETVLHEGDIILVVTSKRMAKEVLQLTGSISDMDLSTKSGDLISRRLLVTSREVAGKSLGLLRLRTRFNINITRIYRSGIDLFQVRV
jgi:putative transport protein